jgi:hypothetical protein
MEKYVRLLTEWKKGNQDGGEYYLEKASLLITVLRTQKSYVKPAGGSQGAWLEKKGAVPLSDIFGRDRVMLTLVDFFDDEAARSVYLQRRIVWFAPVRELLVSGAPGEILAFANLYIGANNAVLNLYGRLTKLLLAR